MIEIAGEEVGAVVARLATLVTVAVADSGMGIDGVGLVRAMKVVVGMVACETAVGCNVDVGAELDILLIDVVARGFPAVTWGKGSSVIGVLKRKMNHSPIYVL